MAVPRDLLDILACPQCKTEVFVDGDQLVCANPECRRAYEVRDDIPIMLIEEAAVLDMNDWERRRAAHSDPTEPKAAEEERES